MKFLVFPGVRAYIGPKISKWISSKGVLVCLDVFDNGSLCIFPQIYSFTYMIMFLDGWKTAHHVFLLEQHKTFAMQMTIPRVPNIRKVCTLGFERMIVMRGNVSLLILIIAVKTLIVYQELCIFHHQREHKSSIE